MGGPLSATGSPPGGNEVLCNGMETPDGLGLRATLARFGTPYVGNASLLACVERGDKDGTEIPTKSSATSSWLSPDMEEASSEPTSVTVTGCLTEEAEEASSDKTTTTASWLAAETEGSTLEETTNKTLCAASWLATETQAIDTLVLEQEGETEETSENFEKAEDHHCVDSLETPEVSHEEGIHLHGQVEEERQVEEESTVCRADDIDDIESLESEAVLMSKGIVEIEDIEDEPLDLEAVEAAAQRAAEEAERAEADDAYDNAECEFPEEAEEAELAEVDELSEKSVNEEEEALSSAFATVAGGTAAEIEAALGVKPSCAEGTCGAGNSGKLLLMMLKGTRGQQPEGAAGAIPAVFGVGKWEPLLRPFCDVTDPKHFVGAEQFGHGHGVSVSGSGTQPVALKDLPNAGLTFMYKPSGWATCSTPQWEGVEGNLIRWVWRRSGYSGSGSGANPCHRLDRGTSGIVVVANSRLALRHIAMQITSRTMVKQYFGLCRGQIDPPQGALSVPLALSRVDKPLGACAAEGRTAVTRYRVLGYFRRNDYLCGHGGSNSGQIYSLVQLQIDHGRQHQIRLHMASINHPLVFDAKYSSSCLRDDARVCTRLFLHAAFVQCTLPPEGAEIMRLPCRLPVQLKQTLTMALRLDRTLESSLQPEAITLCECLLDSEPSSSSTDSNIEARLAVRRRNEFFRCFNFSRAERDEVTQILSRLPTAEERNSALLRFRVLGERTPDFIVTRFEKYVDGLMKQKYQGPGAGSVEDSAQSTQTGILGNESVATNASSIHGGYGPVSMHTENVTCEVCGGQEKMEYVSFPLLNLRLSCRLQAAPMSEPLARLLRNATLPHSTAQLCARSPPPPPPGPPPPLPDDVSRQPVWQERNGSGMKRAEEDADEDIRGDKLSSELIEFLQAHGNTANGPVVASEFASRFNAWVRGDSRRNDGSLRKWIGDQPGVSVEHCGGNRWKVHYDPYAAKNAEYEDYDVDDYQEIEPEAHYSANRRRRRKR